MERIEPYRTLLEPLWTQAQSGQFEIISNELVILETLVKPFREGDTLLESLFSSLFAAREVRLIPSMASLWEHAAHLRSTTGLNTPDALHAATALAAGSSLFVTNDGGFRRVANLAVCVLHEFVE